MLIHQVMSGHVLSSGHVLRSRARARSRLQPHKVERVLQRVGGEEVRQPAGAQPVQLLGARAREVPPFAVARRFGDELPLLQECGEVQRATSGK